MISKNMCFEVRGRLDEMFADKICEIGEPRITKVSFFERIRRAKLWLISRGNIPVGQVSIIPNTHASANLQINSATLITIEASLQKRRNAHTFTRFLNMGGPLCITQCIRQLLYRSR